MISLAKYNYVGTAGATAAATASDGGSAGGGGGVTPAAQVETNKILVTLNTADRDKRQFADAANCTLALPDNFQTVSGVTLTSVEIPVTEFNVNNPKLFFSEFHDTQWVPFSAALSTGNYSVSDFIDGLSSSLTSATALTPEFAAVQNTYSTSYSQNWGRIVISSDGTVPFTLQFRSEPVTVTAAKISPDGEYLTVTLNDQQSAPFSKGAGVIFTPGLSIPAVQCVVSDVDEVSATVNLRIVPVVLNLSSTPSNPEVGQTSTGNVLVPSTKSLMTVFGTTRAGTTVPISSSAILTPFASMATGTDNLGDLFGFGILKDASTDNFGSSKIAALQTPFGKEDGSVTITTNLPHFCQRGTIVRIAGTGTLLDGLQQVTLNIDETHLQIVPNVQPYLDAFPQLIIYIDGPDAEPTTFDIVQSAKLVTATGGIGKILLKLKDKSANYNVFSFANKSVRFAVDNTYYGGVFKSEYGYATAQIGTVTQSPSSSYPDTMELYLNYPTQVLSAVNATLTRVANSFLGAFSPIAEYSICSIQSPNRYDFSRKSRYLFLGLALDGNVIGNFMTTNMPGKRLFSKISLYSGRDVVNFISKSTVEGQYTLQSPLSTVRTVTLSIFDASGNMYKFQGIDFSITLELLCKQPTM